MRKPVLLWFLTEQQWPKFWLHSFLAETLQDLKQERERNRYPVTRDESLNFHRSVLATICTLYSSLFCNTLCFTHVLLLQIKVLRTLWTSTESLTVSSSNNRGNGSSIDFVRFQFRWKCYSFLQLVRGLCCNQEAIKFPKRKRHSFNPHRKYSRWIQELPLMR